MEENKIILYQDDNEITRVSVRFADEDLWLTQKQLAEIYDTTQENISLHVSNVYADGELDEDVYQQCLQMIATGVVDLDRICEYGKYYGDTLLSAMIRLKQMDIFILTAFGLLEQ